MSALLKVRDYWSDIHNRKWDNLPKYFDERAFIHWPNTGESFAVRDFIVVNRENPGVWDVTIVRIEQCESTVITVALVKDGRGEYFVSSFFDFENSRITRLTEFWSENAPAPAWRRAVVPPSDCGAAAKQAAR